MAEPPEPGRPAGLRRKSDRPPPRALVPLVVAVVLLGTAWPVLKIGLQGATPVWFAAWRAALGALASGLLLALLGRLRRPSLVDLPIILSIGGLQLALFFMLANIGLEYVPAGRSVVLAYTTTLWLVPLAALSGERIGPRRAAGAVLGLAGVAVLCNPLALDWTDRRVLIGHGCLLLAALAWALAIFHARRHPWRMSPFEVLPWQMGLAAAILGILARLVEPEGGVSLRPATLAALGYVGLLAGPIAAWAATSVARALPTVVSSLGFLATPVLGLAIASVWLGERLGTPLILGAGCILLGVGLVATARERP